MANDGGAAGRPGVCGVLVTYRRPHVLPGTLDALAGQSCPLAAIVVVDNDPDEAARPVVEGHGLTYLAAGKNLGPAGGLRLGVEALRDSPYEWVMFLDDDDPPPGANIVASMVDFLIETVALDPSCAGVGAAGALFDRRTGRSRRPDMSSPDRRIDVDWIGSGLFPIYRTADLLAVGAPDPTLFWGYDDLDVGLRLRSAGRTLYRDRDYAITDPFDLPTKEMSGASAPWRRYYTTRNLVAIMRREVSRPRAGLVGLRCVLGAFARTPGRRWAAAVCAAQGLRDGLRGVTGRSGSISGP